MNYDLIICGAGPAGAMAAATAARAGLKVALLEKFPLPRHKTCGGGTPMVMQDFLWGLAPEAMVEAQISQMRHTWNFDDPYLAAINPPDTQRSLSIWMVQRPLFDHILVKRAVEAGAELRDGLVVRSLERQTDGVLVRAETWQSATVTAGKTAFVATARYVIGADGANGIVAKVANLRPRRTIALAMEVEHPHQWGSGHPSLQPEIAHLEYNVPRGYAWAFPKADHLNVGAIVFPKQRYALPDCPKLAATLKQLIFAYLDALELSYDPDAMVFHAHPLPIWQGREPLHTSDGSILLAGDAAGLINPFFGDGILHAVKSGEIAANCLIADQPLSYSDRIHDEFAANFDAALTLSRFFYQFPGICYQYGVKNPKAARLATELICGELSFPGILDRALGRIRQATTGRLFGK